MAVCSLTAQGQVTSPLGRFQVDYLRGCTPLTVNVTNISGEINDQYFYDVDTCISTSPKFDAVACTSMTATSTTTFTYSQPGTYTLVQVLTNLVPRTDTLVIEIFNAQTPQFEVLLCSNYEVQVQVNDTIYDQFSIDYGDGSPPTSNLNHTYPSVPGIYPVTLSGFYTDGPQNCADSTINVSPVNNIPTSNISQLTVDVSDPAAGVISLDYIVNNQVNYMLEISTNGSSGFSDVGIVSGNRFTVNGLNTADNFYCFRLAALDPCNNTRSYSDTICSANLLAVALDSQNQLDWTTEIINFNNFEIQKNGNPLGPPITNGGSTSFTDTLVACNVDYCYQLITNYNNGSRSLSSVICVTGISTTIPPAVQSITVSVDGPSITVDWQVPDTVNFQLNSYTLSRSINNEPFQIIANPNIIPFTDVNLRTQVNTHCYGLVYEDRCGNQSGASVTACAVLLLGDNIDNRNFVLSWSPYLGWENGVSEYQIEIMDENGALIGSPVVVSSGTTNYTDLITATRQITQYRIVAISNDVNPLISYSNIVVLDIPVQVFLPNSFTPNNDGLNDIFLAKGLFIEEFSMEIYSRWGELLFRSEDLDEGWDGVYKGSLVPDGSYVYQVTAIDPQGRAVNKSGAVNVLSKMN